MWSGALIHDLYHKINTEMFNRAANTMNLYFTQRHTHTHTHTHTDTHTHTLNCTPHKIPILTHKHIRCLGNRLHMVGGGRGPTVGSVKTRRGAQPGHSLRLTGPNTPDGLSKDTESPLILMSWMHPTKDDVTGSACCIAISAAEKGAQGWVGENACTCEFNNDWIHSGRNRFILTRNAPHIQGVFGQMYRGGRRSDLIMVHRVHVQLHNIHPLDHWKTHGQRRHTDRTFIPESWISSNRSPSSPWDEVTLPEILWNLPSHKETFGFTDTLNSPLPLLACATTWRWERVQTLAVTRRVKAPSTLNVRSAL